VCVCAMRDWLRFAAAAARLCARHRGGSGVLWGAKRGRERETEREREPTLLLTTSEWRASARPTHTHRQRQRDRRTHTHRQTWRQSCRDGSQLHTRALGLGGWLWSAAARPAVRENETVCAAAAHNEFRRERKKSTNAAVPPLLRADLALRVCSISCSLCYRNVCGQHIEFVREKRILSRLISTKCYNERGHEIERNQNFSSLIRITHRDTTTYTQRHSHTRTQHIDKLFKNFLLCHHCFPCTLIYIVYIKFNSLSPLAYIHIHWNISL